MSKKIIIPDIGTSNKVDVIAVLVKVGDKIEIDTPLATLEGDKASMDIPSSDAGVVESIAIKAGDKVSQGDVICIVETPFMASQSPSATSQSPVPTSMPASQPVAAPSITQNIINSDAMNGVSTIHASPSIRRIAHELDVNLSKIKGTGEKNRITKDDIKHYLSRGNTNSSGAGLNLLPPPVVDFAKFGATESQPLSKIKKISGANLHRNWVMIPHITQFIESDITELEAFRQESKAKAEKKGFKLTPLVFIIKAVVAALKKFPQFNASLDGDNLILKKYFHIGVAVDTPNGLVVPVIRNADQKGIFELAQELDVISKKARDGKLTMMDMQGGCFSISSLGGIGGTAFTPIINAPEVAILGVSQSTYKPIYQPKQRDGEQGNHFVPRLMLPLSLSYDHRVIDGADGARFAVYLSQCLTDIRTLLL